MPDIDNVKLRRLDLTTLMVFEALMRTRKATTVAAQLGLTQSSVSHALKRLREVFGDELFLRRPHGLAPTAFAAALEAPVRRALEDLRQALSGPPAFDPAASTGVVRIAGQDHEHADITPRLIKRLAAAAPGMRIVLRPLVREAALDALANAQVDLALGYFWRLSDEFAAETLYTEDYAVAGKRTAFGGQRLTLKRYTSARHVLVSPAGELHGVVDSALARQGLERIVVAATPSFFSALAIAAETGALATVPKRFAVAFARKFGLAVAPPPLPLRSFTVSAVRHRRDARNPMLDWLTPLLKDD